MRIYGEGDDVRIAVRYNVCLTLSDPTVGLEEGYAQVKSVALMA